ncbi:MAG: preprotein translocase subunit SecG [Alphaproteobacteria bacterium]
MESVVLVIHLILALAIIGLVLLQRSEGGGLGIGGGGGGLGNLASARGTANMLTKMTALCAAGFFVTSLTLGVMAGGQSQPEKGILADIDSSEVVAPVEAPSDVSAPVVTYTQPEESPAIPAIKEQIDSATPEAPTDIPSTPTE